MDRTSKIDGVRAQSAQRYGQRPEGSATLPQRIRESVSGLIKEPYGSLPIGAFTGFPAALNTYTTKAGSSSSSNGTGEFPMAFGSSHHQQAASDHSESFRSTDKRCRVGRIDGQVAFDGFLMGLGDLDLEAHLAPDQPSLRGGHQGGFSTRITKDCGLRVQDWETRKIPDKPQHITDVNNDGAAVVALLSDPAFTVEQETPSLLDLGNDSTEVQKCKNSHQGSYPTKCVASSHSLNPLGLVPNFGVPWKSGHASPATEKGINREGYFQESSFGDIEPWVGILDRYHEEVWGDNLPFIKEARAETNMTGKDQPDSDDGPATRRLKMVLQHVGHSKNR